MTSSPEAKRRMGHKRMVLWGLLVILAGTMIMPLSGYVYVNIAPAVAAEQQSNPRSNFWRDVRQGREGYGASSGAYTQNAFIQNGGEIWREVRNGPLATYGAGLLAVGLVGVLLFHLLAGPARLEHGRSGSKVYRWTLFERILHWYVAILFIILAITGLSLLYGRAVLIPLLGLEGFSAYASVAIASHNYLGVFFVIGLVVMLAIWLKESLFKRHDWQWLKQGGGYVGHSKEHPHAGRVNAGEKIWFWLLFVAGLAVSVTGLILDFPNLGFGTTAMQLSTLIHAALGVVLIALSFGHIYLGTLGNEGTFEGMVSGYVDENWARQHHDLWYEQIQKEGADRTPGPEEHPRTPKTSPG